MELGIGVFTSWEIILLDPQKLHDVRGIAIPTLQMKKLGAKGVLRLAQFAELVSHTVAKPGSPTGATLGQPGSRKYPWEEQEARWVEDGILSSP